MCNLIQFVQWPEQKIADSNGTVTLGILGKDPFGDAFEPVMDKRFDNRILVIKRFPGLSEAKKKAGSREAELTQLMDAVRKCDLLFICGSEKGAWGDIVKALGNQPVLTVADVPGFLEAGGIVNFLVEEKKVGFEINLAAAEKAGLKIRSQLLRLAKRVVKQDKAQN